MGWLGPPLGDVQGVPLATLVAIAVGVLVLLARVVRVGQFSAGPASTALSTRRPGWIARRRARAGIRHRHGRVGVGYISALRTVHLTLAELAGHCLAVGGP